ncbi:putative hydrolase [Gordonia araii NBRC 100433]|uniref:Putative hydrolase n=1 Tax=Gordonia araii NBRC 100433 TaxID=1073574 RepID=G7GX91_9ACTN|nr:alpha/beta hydrolase [Gordonia araii]NNG98989.1 alpha/beta hydrolase [Gordonia araii NBRC 100433]GAB08216.1 putative hydrolase [Gordonia araii NBRC 100433]
MTGITFRGLTAACAAAVVVTAASIGTAGAAPRQPAPSAAASAPSVHAEFGKPGPLKVATNYASGPCDRSLMGLIMGLQAHAEGNYETATCSDAFPYGLGSPVGVQIFAPVGKKAKGPYPAVIFMPGIAGNSAQYTALARNWASHGFIVAIPFTFWNSLVEVPTLGTAVLAHLNGQRGDPLYRKVDFSRVTYAGHSAGGQGALQAASVYQSAGRAVIPNFRVVGVFAIQNGPLAVGATVHVPALILGGRKDVVVPPWAWQKVYQYNGLRTAPAYFAVSKSAHHLDVARSARTNPFIGVTTAWLLHVAYRDRRAGEFFVGKRWLLPRDKAFDEVLRNPAAARLRAPSSPRVPGGTG